MNGMSVGSLFSGIGGLDLGLERAGMRVRWQVENDAYCNRVLARNWPNVRRYGDIRELAGDGLEPVDLICGGFPCQPVSLAGRRRGDADERWFWPEMQRVCSLVRPRWILVENVPGLLSIDAGRLFGTVLRDLAESRYDAEWDCIPAAALGAPHIRNRIFIVAHASGCGCGPEGRGLREGDTAELRVGRSANRSDQTGAGDEISDTDGPGCGEQRRAESVFAGHAAIEQCDWWKVEPPFCRVVDGFPGRVDQLRGLGNAVVPQIAEWIGRRIMGTDHNIGNDRDGTDV